MGTLWNDHIANKITVLSFAMMTSPNNFYRVAEIILMFLKRKDVFIQNLKEVGRLFIVSSWVTLREWISSIYKMIRKKVHWKVEFILSSNKLVRTFKIALENNQVSAMYWKHIDSNGAGPVFNDWYIRSSHRRCSVRKGVLRNFAKFTETHLYHSRCRTAFLQNTSKRVLL